MAKNKNKTKQKTNKFWIMRMHQIKIFHILVPNPGEIHQFGHKIAFSVPFTAMTAKKNDYGLKMAFIWCIFGIQRVTRILSVFIHAYS